MNILVVDDEEMIRWLLKKRLTHEGYKVIEAGCGDGALSAIEQEQPDLVLLDIFLPKVNGMSVLKKIQERSPELPVIMMSASTDINMSVEAMKNGAYDYVVKPFNDDELVLTVKRVQEYLRLRNEVNQHKAGYSLRSLVGSSKIMQNLSHMIKTVAKSQASTILIRGESGTGKDMIAKIIHYESSRSNKPFMNITCTALQDTLLESELFGHEKGSFTDAKIQKRGLFEIANDGSVFLDEIGDMLPSIQAKVLRVLDDKTFRRVGGTQDIHVDVRLIAATNCNLEKLIHEKKFREDLYYRLNIITIDVPPLRDRREDIPLLVKHFLNVFGKSLCKGSIDVDPEVLRKFEKYHWPGNIRELKNVIERAVILSSGKNNPVISLEDVVLGPSSTLELGGSHTIRLPEAGLNLEALEKDLLIQALERTGGNQTRAGQLLGLTRDQVHYRMDKFGLLDKSPALTSADSRNSLHQNWQ